MGQLSSELLQEIVSASAQALLVVDAASTGCKIVYANPAYEARSGYALAELEGTAWLEQAAAEEDTPDLARLRRGILADEPQKTSVPFLRKDGDIWLGRLQSTPLAVGGPEHRYVLIQFEPEDAALSKTASSQMAKRALGTQRRKLVVSDRIDPVTGLMSPDRFRLLLRRELAVAQRAATPLCLMLFHVPELDIYRKTFGVNAADSSLRMIGAQITGTFRRASDLCARFDEATLAVAVRGQDESEARPLVELVERKVRNLSLHNPRARRSRHIVAHGSCIAARPESEDVSELTARAAASLEGETAAEPRQASAG